LYSVGKIIANDLLFHVRSLKLSQFGDVEKLHAAKAGAPLVEGGGADAHFSANIRYAKTSLNAFHGVHDLAISEF